ncbi:MAG: YebC/PmpR family DNA-binding transcriptional regulator [Patescibacteria group bacterium]
MAGHNKWKQIKNKKAAEDGRKSKIFTKLNRLITVEAKKSNGNTDAPGLRSAIEKARELNMPNENILRAVKKATEVTGVAMESVTYEAYGPGGCALIIEGLTDNRNKAAAEIRHILSECGFELAATGSALWAFEKTGNVWNPKTTVSLSETDTLKLEEIVNNLEDNDEVQEVFTNVE